MKEGIPVQPYLDKMQEKEFEVSREEVDESVARLSKPFRKMRERSGGVVEIRFEDVKIEIGYAPPEAHGDRLAKRVIRLAFEKDGEKADVMQGLSQTKIFAGGSRFGSNEHGRTISRADNNLEENIVYLRDEIYSPHTLLVLLHEIGHVLDGEAAIASGGKAFGEHRDADLAEVIRRERAANAFVLKAIRPYLSSKDVRRDVVNTLIHDSLETYYQATKGEIAARNQGVEKGMNLGLNAQDREEFERED